jgi:hypothetical protein
LPILTNTGEKAKWFENYALFAALFGIEAKIDRIHSAGKIGDIQLYLGWVKGDTKYLET